MRQEKFEFQRLRHFEAVYRLHSFRKAADELQMTDSALSRSIQRLEEDLGFRLFDRTTRSVEPTDSAEAIHEQSLEILQRVDALGREVERLKEGQVGEVRVGAGPLSIETVIQPSLLQFSARYPGVSVQVSTGAPHDMFAQLAERRIDLILYESGYYNSLPQKDEVICTPLAEEAVLVVHRPEHPVLRTEGTIQDYLAFPWVAPIVQSRYAMRIPSEMLALMGQYQQPKYRVDNLHLCLELAAGGDVITVAPEHIAREWQKTGRLQIAAQQLPMTTRIAVYHARGRTLTKAVEALRAMFLDPQPGFPSRRGAVRTGANSTTKMPNPADQSTPDTTKRGT